MTEDDDEPESRNRLGFGALIVGIVCIAVEMLGSYTAGGATPTSSIDGLSALNLLLIVAAPISCGIAAANLTTSDEPAVRAFKGLLVGVVVLVAMLYFGFLAWSFGGGRMRM